jgi:deazaflavin-dependent oxidoreductase (nitroreductase family)
MDGLAGARGVVIPIRLRPAAVAGAFPDGSRCLEEDVVTGIVQRVSDWAYFCGESLTLKLTGTGPPKGWRGRVLRSPVALYDWGLGAAIGGRILVLGTIGRTTGKRRETPLEYLHDEASDTYFLMAGWRGRTDWFRNLTADPRVRVRVGRRRFVAQARVLEADEGAAALRSWIQRTPRIASILERDTGIRYDGSPTSAQALAAHYGIVALQPFVVAR